MSFKIVESHRLQEVPPYLFAELDRMRQQMKERGVEVMDMSVGDPDLATPAAIVEHLAEAVRDAATHRYPPYQGTKELRQAVAAWYKRRFGVVVNPETEVLITLGSKDAIAHIPLAFVNYGDYTLVPDPGYPVYGIASEFAAGLSYRMPLLPDEHYLPHLASIPSNVANRAKLIFLNYPNNPTSAVAELEFFNEAVQFARKYNVILCNDAAYATVVFDGAKPVSLLQAPGAKQIGIEFHSFSKMFNMTGWRIGFAAGNAEIIRALGRLKTNIDSGVFVAIQRAAAAALGREEELAQPSLAVYQRRRDRVAALLNGCGLEFEKPRGTFYFWLRVPTKEGSVAFCKRLLDQAGVIATPGVGFGGYGESFFRLSTTLPEEKLEAGCNRLRRFLAGEKAI